MKKIIYSFFIVCLFNKAIAQLSGIINVPLTYTSIASVISALNSQGISGSVTVNISAGYTETTSAGGFSLTATGASASPVIFRKFGSGSNPLITAYNGGSGTPGSMNQDGIWRLIGCDYITIDGIDLVDLNTSNPSTMEFGYGLFKANGTDGCQNNTIKNCVITLSRINNASGSGSAEDGSRGIDVVNALTGVHNSSVTVTSFSGSHSNNKFYSNTIQNCNIGISLVGYADLTPFNFSDIGNDIGGNSISTGNTIINFGGGGVANASTAIRTALQYNLNVSFNKIDNNTGSGINHATSLRGIQVNSAASANSSINNNTLTLHGGGTSSQLTAIENASGSTPSSNTISINNNLILNCTYASSLSGPFYGIWNTASSDVLNMNGNSFVNNSTSAASGSTYLIYNNGATASSININNNNLSLAYNGSAPYTGSMYSVYNGNGTAATAVNINNNTFANYSHSFPATGNLYFIYNTNDSYSISVIGNTWDNLSLNHSGAEYFINNNSSTQAFVNVSNNSITGTFNRTATSGATYLYYSTGASPSSCIQTFIGNNFSNINGAIAGTGIFYGLYNSDGATSPYPKKIISNNTISNVTINSTGSFYGYYADNLGDGTSSTGSIVNGNVLASITRAGTIYGMYISGNVSPNYAPQVYSNTIQNLNSSGASSNLYSVYLTGGGAGLNFYKNKISNSAETGTAGVAHGVYVASSITTTLSNNFIGHINAPNSSAANAVNGIYINGGTLVHTLYNTVFLNAQSSGGNFNSNALYASTTTSLNLRNNIFVNLSSGGTGIAAAYRRSSTALTNYLSSSNNNLFYAGVPTTSNVILQTSSTAYQTMSTFQSAVSPRESTSGSQNVNFLSTVGSSPNYLLLLPNAASMAESGAVNVAGITDDYDNQIRQGNTGYTGTGTAPDIGADEYNQNLTPCIGANAGIISPLSYSLCAGQSATLISNGYTQGVGLTHQWKVATNSGGPYQSISGGSGITTPEFNSSQLTAGTYFFVMVTTCTSVPVSGSSSEVTVVVNPIPLVSAISNSSLVCAGQVINFTGLSSVPGNYQWTGPNGFNSAVLNPTLTNSSVNASGIYYFFASANGCVSAQATVALIVSEVTLSVAASTPVLCLGNNATLTLNSSALTYTWNTGANTNSISVSPTVSAIYSVAVTNTANCTASKTLTISVINPSISATNTFVCSNTTTAVLNVNAFTPSLINWYASPGSTTSLGSGAIYTTTISATTTFYAEASNTLSGCQSVRVPLTVTLSTGPSLSVLANPIVICPGKSSTITASGATTYSFVSIGSGSMHVVSPTSQHVYTVTGKNTLGCLSTETVLVGTYSVATIYAIQTASLVCPSSVVGFTASGANSYYWNTGTNGPVTTVVPAANSTYTVYGTNSQSCVSTATLAVITRSVPVITIVQSTNNLCPGEVITFTAMGANSYTWLPGNIVSHTFSANPVVPAVYNAIGKSINTCTNVAIANVSVDPCTSIKENKKNATVSFFPNPSQGIITFRAEFIEEYQVIIISSLGNSVREIVINESNSTFDLSDLTKGIYFVKMISKKETRVTKLILN